MSEEDEEYVQAWQANNPTIHQPPYDPIKLDEGDTDDCFTLLQVCDGVIVRDLDALIALRDAIDEKIEEVGNRE